VSLGGGVGRRLLRVRGTRGEGRGWKGLERGYKGLAKDWKGVGVGFLREVTWDLSTTYLGFY